MSNPQIDQLQNPYHPPAHEPGAMEVQAATLFSARSGGQLSYKVGRIAPLLEIVCLILFGFVPFPLRDVCVPTWYIMCVSAFTRLPVSAVIAWYGVLVLVIGILRGSRGVQFGTSVIFCMLLAASVLKMWGRILLDGPVNWSGLVRDPWMMCTILPLAIALMSCFATRLFGMIALSRSERQFTLRDALIFVAATGIFLAILAPLIDWR